MDGNQSAGIGRLRCIAAIFLPILRHGVTGQVFGRNDRRITENAGPERACHTHERAQGRPKGLARRPLFPEGGLRANGLTANARRLDRFVQVFERLTARDKAGDSIGHRHRNRPGAGFQRGINLNHTALGRHADGLAAFPVFRGQAFHHGVTVAAILALGKRGRRQNDGCSKGKGGKFELNLRPFRRQFAPLAKSPDFQDYIPLG